MESALEDDHLHVSFEITGFPKNTLGQSPIAMSGLFWVPQRGVKDVDQSWIEASEPLKLNSTSQLEIDGEYPANEGLKIILQSPPVFGVPREPYFLDFIGYGERKTWSLLIAEARNAQGQKATPEIIASWSIITLARRVVGDPTNPKLPDNWIAKTQFKLWSLRLHTPLPEDKN